MAQHGDAVLTAARSRKSKFEVYIKLLFIKNIIRSTVRVEHGALALLPGRGGEASATVLA